MTRPLALGLLAAPALALACGSPAEPVDPVPATIAISNGDNQTGTTGAFLGAPLVARVRNAGGDPLLGVEVEWAEDFGGGMPEESVSRTAANGEAYMRYRLGPAPGINTIVARVRGTTLEVLFTANANSVGAGSPLPAGLPPR